jgi:hypothetical protein
LYAIITRGVAGSPGTGDPSPISVEAPETTPTTDPSAPEIQPGVSR